MSKRNIKYKLRSDRTLAVLVGVKEYDNFSSILPAFNNVQSFSDLLQDQDLFGIPPERVITIQGGESKDIIEQIRRALPESRKEAREKKLENLIFYFTGHGIRTRDNKDYFLASQETDIFHVNNFQNTGIRYQGIMQMIADSGINKRIVIIDACHSGMAVMGEEDELEKELFAHKGTFTLTSSNSTEKSYFNPDEDFSEFTREFLGTLKEGIPSEVEMVDLASLYKELKRRVGLRNPGMRPQYRASEEITGEDFLFVKNSRFDVDLIKRQDFLRDLEEYRAEIRLGKVRRTQRLLKGFKDDALNDLKDGPEKEKLLQAIEAEIEFCRQYPRYKEIIEPLIREKVEDQVKDLEDRISSLEEGNGSDFSKLENQVDHLGAVRDQLLTEGERKDTTIAELKKRESGLLREVEALNKENAAQQEVINSLKAELDAKAQQNESSPRKSSSIPSILILKKSFMVKEFDFEMVRVKGGTMNVPVFSHVGEKEPNEWRELNLETFFLAKYPVTQTLWKSVMGELPEHLHFPNRDDCPVEGVSWEEALDFISGLNGLTGGEFRLPSEAEWEYAARGGQFTNGFLYAGSHAVNEVAWTRNNSNGQPKPVGRLRPNELEIYDLCGNVWEWCRDNWFGLNHDAEESEEDIEYVETDYRVVRGGSWNDPVEVCRIDSKTYWGPEFRLNNLGFRLAHS